LEFSDFNRQAYLLLYPSVEICSGLLKRLGFLKFGQTAVSLLRLSDNIEIFLMYWLLLNCGMLYAIYFIFYACLVRSVVKASLSFLRRFSRRHFHLHSLRRCGSSANLTVGLSPSFYFSPTTWLQLAQILVRDPPWRLECWSSRWS